MTEKTGSGLFAIHFSGCIVVAPEYEDGEQIQEPQFVVAENINDIIDRGELVIECTELTPENLKDHVWAKTEWPYGDGADGGIHVEEQVHMSPRERTKIEIQRRIANLASELAEL